MALVIKKRIIPHCVNDIPSLYEDIMKGYCIQELASFSEQKEEGYYLKLYAPGYDDNGTAEVIANCLL